MEQIIDLRKCKKGDQLRLRNGEVVEYKGPHNQPGEFYNHRASKGNYGDNGRYWEYDEDEWDVIEIITNKTMTEAEKNAKIEDIEKQLKELRETPTAPQLELKDKHVYRREDGKIIHIYQLGRSSWAGICDGECYHRYQSDGTNEFGKQSLIVECIGQIGVVHEDYLLTLNSGSAGIYSHAETYSPDHLTGEKIQG